LEKNKKDFHFHFLFIFIFLFKDFVGTSCRNFHETTLLQLGKPKDLKGLLHMLSTTMNFYKGELGVSITFSFILFEDEQNLGVGLFV